MKPKIVTILLSTLFSIALWVFISFSYEYTTTIRVPIKFVDIKEGYAISDQSTASISLTIKGTGWVLAQKIVGPQTMFFISANKKTGTFKVDTRDALSDNRWINPSLHVAMVSPAELYFTVERKSEKIVPIFSKAKLKIKKGYGIVSKIVLEPDSVRISGPLSIIRNIKNIDTEFKELTELEGNVETKIKLHPINYVVYSNNYTTIKFAVQKIVDKVFNNVPVNAVNVPKFRTLELFPHFVDVTLRGGLENLGVMTKDSITAVVDFNDAFLDTLGGVQPKIAHPEFTTLTNVNPKTLKYIIKQY